jgi:hypothetical protein
MLYLWSVSLLLAMVTSAVVVIRLFFDFAAESFGVWRHYGFLQDVNSLCRLPIILCLAVSFIAYMDSHEGSKRRKYVFVINLASTIANIFYPEVAVVR